MVPNRATHHTYETLCAVCNHLYNSKNVKKTHGGMLHLPATLLKLTLFHGCFSRFFELYSGTESRKASCWQIYGQLCKLWVKTF